MDMTVPLFLGLLALASVSLFLAYVGWFKKSLNAGKMFAVLMLSMAWYSFFAGFEILAAGVQWKLVWNNVIYLGAVSIGPLWLLLAVEYSGLGAKMPRKAAAFLFIVPAFTLLFKYTDSWHHLCYSNVSVTHGFPFSQISFQRGPWYWVHMGYSGLTVLAGSLLYVQAFFQATPAHRPQAACMLGAISAPIIVLCLYSFVPFFWSIDLNPLGFSVASFFFVIGLFRFNLLDAKPITWKKVVEALSAALIILDARDRVVGVNPRAKKLLRQARMRTGDPSWSAVVEAIPDFAKMDLNNERQMIEFRLRGGDDGFSGGKAQVVFIRDHEDSLSGKTVVITPYGSAGQIRSASPADDERDMRTVERVVREQKAYRNPEITLPELAERLGLPRNRLSFLINTYHGKAFNDFINDLRVEEAETLLTKPGVTVLDAAFSVGFNSKTTFYAAFKKTTGLNPTEYQKRQKPAQTVSGKIASDDQF